jgi:iron complex outermembrane receptor protein
MLKSKERMSDTAEWKTDLATYSTSTKVVTPRFKSQWTVGLEQPDVHWQMMINYTTGYKDKDITATRVDTQKSEVISGRKVPGFVTADVMALFKLGTRTQIRAGVTNVTNRTPPLSFYSANDLSWGLDAQVLSGVCLWTSVPRSTWTVPPGKPSAIKAQFMINA